MYVIHQDSPRVRQDQSAERHTAVTRPLDEMSVLNRLLDPDDLDVIVELAKIAGISPLELLRTQLAGTITDMAQALDWFHNHEGAGKEREYARALLLCPGPESLAEGLRACDPSYQPNESAHRESVQRQARANWQQFKAN